MLNFLFQDAVKIVLAHEGGLSDDPHDPGGLTNLGISERFCKDNNLHIDIKQLTPDQAKPIYYKYFWTPYGFQQLTNKEITIKLFDTTVNIGPSEAIKLAQHCLSLFKPIIGIDGILGPNTAAAINSLNADDTAIFLTNYRQYLEQYYKELVIDKPELQKFLQGFINRALS